MLGLAENRHYLSNYMAGDCGLWDEAKAKQQTNINLANFMDEQEQFNKRAVSAIYLQGVLLAKLGIDRDTTRVNDDIMAAVDALKAASKAPCCHVVTGAEGTSYCGLAENAVLALRMQLGAANHALGQLAALIQEAGAPDFSSAQHAHDWAVETAALRAKAREVAS